MQVQAQNLQRDGQFDCGFMNLAAFSLSNGASSVAEQNIIHAWKPSSQTMTAT